MSPPATMFAEESTAVGFARIQHPQQRKILRFPSIVDSTKCIDYYGFDEPEADGLFGIIRIRNYGKESLSVIRSHVESALSNRDLTPSLQNMIKQGISEIAENGHKHERLILDESDEASKLGLYSLSYRGKDIIAAVFSSPANGCPEEDLNGGGGYLMIRAGRGIYVNNYSQRSDGRHRMFISAVGWVNNKNVDGQRRETIARNASGITADLMESLLRPGFAYSPSDVAPLRVVSKRFDDGLKDRLRTLMREWEGKDMVLPSTIEETAPSYDGFRLIRALRTPRATRYLGAYRTATNQVLDEFGVPEILGGIRNRALLCFDERVMNAIEHGCGDEIEGRFYFFTVDYTGGPRQVLCFLAKNRAQNDFDGSAPIPSGLAEQGLGQRGFDGMGRFLINKIATADPALRNGNYVYATASIAYGPPSNNGLGSIVKSKLIELAAKVAAENPF